MSPHLLTLEFSATSKVASDLHNQIVRLIKEKQSAGLIKSFNHALGTNWLETAEEVTELRAAANRAVVPAPPWRE